MAESTPRLAIGTVQWGLPYGVANRDGQPNRRTVRELMDVAFAAGVDVLDTARAYGDSEAVIGDLLSDAERSFVRVVTKLSPTVWSDGIDGAAAVARTRESVRLSLQALRVERLDTLLLHRPDHRTCCGGQVWDWLLAERATGKIGRLGVSAATPEQANAALADPDVELLQVPSSILDQRLVRSGFFEAAGKVGTEIHVRSVYLQGLAFLEADRVPEHFESVREHLRSIRVTAAELGLLPGEVWMAYARTLPVTRLVVGSETVAQLRSNLAGFESPIPAQVGQLAAGLDLVPDEVADPARWRV